MRFMENLKLALSRRQDNAPPESVGHWPENEAITKINRIRLGTVTILSAIATALALPTSDACAWGADCPIDGGLRCKPVPHYEIFPGAAESSTSCEPAV